MVYLLGSKPESNKVALLVEKKIFGREILEVSS